MASDLDFDQQCCCLEALLLSGVDDDCGSTLLLWQKVMEHVQQLKDDLEQATAEVAAAKQILSDIEDMAHYAKPTGTAPAQPTSPTTVVTIQPTKKG